MGPWGNKLHNNGLGQTFINDTSAQIVETVERAVFDESAWDDFVEILGGAIPGTGAVVQRFDLRRKRLACDRIVNMDPDDVASYRQHYSGLNPWIRHLREAASGKVLVSERDFPSAKFENAEFYNWLPAHFRAAAAVTVEASRENMIFVAMHYGVDRAVDYDRPVSDLLQGISKPLLRSMEAAQLVEHAIDRERSAAAVVSRSGDIACVVDEQLRVKDANPRAENEFRRREAISMRAGRVSLPAADINGWLAGTVRLLAAGLEPQATTRIFQAEATYQIAVLRLPGGSGMRLLFSGGPLFLIVVRNLSERSEAGTIADLATAFGLTPAEQRLCQVLLLGHSLKEAADMLAVTSETARQRLKAIFQKTDTHKQSELIALLGRLL